MRQGLPDAAAVDALVSRIGSPTCTCYALSLLGDRASAEDVTALAFERLLRARGRLDPRRGSPRALLFTIARNAALDELRRRRRRQPAASPAAESLAAAAAPGMDAEDVERRDSVRRALAELAPRDREIVLLEFHGQLDERGARARARDQRVQRRHAAAPRARAPARDTRSGRGRWHQGVSRSPGATGRGWLGAEIDAALNGELAGPEASALRELAAGRARAGRGPGRRVRARAAGAGGGVGARAA